MKTYFIISVLLFVISDLMAQTQSDYTIRCLTSKGYQTGSERGISKSKDVACACYNRHYFSFSSMLTRTVTFKIKQPIASQIVSKNGDRTQVFENAEDGTTPAGYFMVDVIYREGKRIILVNYTMQGQFFLMENCQSVDNPETLIIGMELKNMK